jgi:hypothetical protein
MPAVGEDAAWKVPQVWLESEQAVSNINPNFAEARRLATPFPVWQKDDALPAELYQSLVDEFPDDEAFSRGMEVMGGRRRIASDESGFYEFLETSPAWNTLFQAINSQDFVGHILSHISDEAAAYGPRLKLAEARLNRDYFEGRARASKYLPRKAVSVFQRVTDVFSPEDEVFLHFDISSAHDGYTREIHRDTDPRIAVMLIQFSGQTEIQCDGGEFGVHSYIDPPAGGAFARQPEESGMRTDVLLPPKENTALLFLSTPHSYHSVPLMRNAKANRNFIYVGISWRKKFKWYSELPPELATA